jgi:protein-S-isoprenylcysteine O-methyltransferase Ste14
MSDNGDHGAAVRIAPPLVYLAGVVIGVLVHAFLAPFPIGLSMGARIAMALAAAVPALVLMGGAIGLFRRTGQDPKPWTPTPELVTTGVYRMTRNPMYIGMALLQIAMGAALANGWIIMLVPVVLGVVYASAVRHEERYLQTRFGEPYTRYKQSVRRWL